MAIRPAVPVILLAALLAACARPTGDFGRARPSPLHDEILPAIGDNLARDHRLEPVSTFNLTDIERELRDRAWTFQRAPHTDDWRTDIEVEWQRTRLSAPVDSTFDPRRYHALLASDRYVSSEGRWGRVILDIEADAMMVPAFCAVAAQVRRMDVERLAAAGRQATADEAFRADAAARVWENAEVTAWAYRALVFRLAAYRFAIDRLQVETPSGQLLAANRAHAALAATRCREAPALSSLPAVMAARPGRLAATGPGWDPFDAPVAQK